MSDCDCCFYSGCKCVGGDKEPGDKDKADAERWRKLERLSASPRVENICFIDLTADEYEQFKAWAEGIGYKFAFERQGLQKVLEYLEQKIDSIKE